MLARLFRRHSPQLPSSSAELADALRAAAPFADSDDARNEYIAAADALDRAITSTRQHGDEPTRDALAYALGRAELNLKDQLSELIEVVKEDHILIQDIHTGQADQGAAVTALRAEFRDGMQLVGERLTDVEGRATVLETTVAAHDRSRDQSIEERRLLRRDMDESKAHRAKLQATLDQIDKRLAEIERLLELAGDHHEAGG
jgi:hypothetical protein